MRTYVFSRTLSNAQVQPEVTLITDNSAEAIADLKAESGKAIWLMGGGVLFRSLLEAGLVDCVEVGMIPVLLGQGIPILPSGPGRIPLTLTDSKTYPNGIVLLNFDVQ